MKTYLFLLAIITMTAQTSLAQEWVSQEARYQDKPIVEMTLNNKKTWVLLDTGSDISVLNLKSQDKYGFNAHQDFNQEFKVAGFGSRQNHLHQVTDAQLYFGEVKLKSQFYAYDISNIVASIKARTGNTVTAIIGTNLMRSYGFVIDMGSRTVSMNYKVKKKDLKPDQEDSEFTIAKNFDK